MSSIVLLPRPVRIAPLIEFNPSSVGTLVQDFDLRFGVTLNGGDVSDIADQETGTAPGDALVQATAADQPTFNSTDSDFNGHPSMTFPGATEFMATAAYGTPLTQPNTICFVFKYLTTPPNFEFLFDGPSGGRHLMVDNDDPWAVGTDTQLSGQVSDNDPHIMIARFNTTSSDWYLEGGTAEGSGSIAADDMDGLSIASRFVGTTNANLTMTRFLVYSDLLTDEEVDLLGNGMEALYGINWTAIA